MQPDGAPLDGPATAGRPRHLPPLVYPAIAGALSLAVSWQHWIDPLVDSGRELNTPLRLAAGERLYSDVGYYYGPLSPWLHSAVLAIAGPHWAVLQAISLGLGAAVLALLYRLVLRAGSQTSAILATTLGAAICFGAPGGGAFAFSYSSAGLLAMAGALVALNSSLAESGSRATLFIGSAGLAGALASRPEIGLAAGAAIVLSALRTSSERLARAAASQPPLRIRRSIGILGVGALIAIAMYAVAFFDVSVQELIARGPLRHWLAMPPEWRLLYLRVSGLAQPWPSIQSMLFGLAIGLALLFAAALGTRSRRLTWAWVVSAAACAVALASLSERTLNSSLPQFSAPLPLLAIVATGFVFLRPSSPVNQARLSLFAFAALVGSRVLLGLRVEPKMTAYCPLPLPLLLATACVVILDMLAPRLAGPREFRWRSSALAAALAILFLIRVAEQNSDLMTLRTAAGSLRLPPPKAVALGEAFQYLADHANKGDMLVAFPEGGFFNFVSGLPSPLREEQVFPGILGPEDEDDIVERLALTKPRFVLLVNRPASEYGARSFGQDYAVRLWAAVTADYRLVASFGQASDNSPVGSRRFFIRCYEREPVGSTPVVPASLSSRSGE